MRRTINKTSGTIVCRNKDIYYLEIPAQQSVMTRNGNDLVLDFPAGDKLTFAGFYTKSVSFVLDEETVSTADFFRALKLEHLIPASGSSFPSAQTQVGTDHSSHHSWDTMEALEGIWHLKGLDIGFEYSREPQEVIHANPWIERPAAPAIPSDPYIEDIADEAFLDRPVVIHIPGGVELVSVVCDGPGRVEMLPDGTWAYYPDPIDSGDIPGRNDVPGGGSVTVTVKWPDGSIHKYDIPITIHDDVPEASDDSATGTDKGAVSGNVLENDDFGADGPHSKEPVRWLDTVGEHGKLEVDEDGYWTYTPDPGFKLPVGETVTEIFEYIIKDSDGDESRAYLKITITGTDNPVTVTPENPLPPDPDIPEIPIDPDYPVKFPVGVLPSVVLVKEKDLADGPVRVSESFNIKAPDGVAEIFINGKLIWKDGELLENEFPTDEGKLLITGFDPDTGKLAYAFVLEKATREHGQPGRDTISHPFEVRVIDRDGSGDAGYISVRIVDDIPEARSDKNQVSEDDPEASGNVLLNDVYGQDGAGKFEWLDKPEARYGEITLNPDGTYAYTLNPELPEVAALPPGETLTETFRYKITDADGDESESVLTIIITGVDNEVSITPEHPVPNPDDSSLTASAVIVREQDLGTGHPVKSGSFLIHAGKGLGEIRIGGETVWKKEDGLFSDVELATDEGLLRVVSFDEETGRLTYSFALQHATNEHQEQGRDAIHHSFDVTVTDLPGKSASSTIIANVIDDIPEISAGAGVSVFCGETVEVDDLSFDFGADGRGKLLVSVDGRTVEVSDPCSEWSIEGRFGTLKSDGCGNYAYSAKAVEEDALGETVDGEAKALPDQFQDRFSLSLIDSDDDTTETDWTVSVSKPEYIGKTEIPEVLHRPLHLGESEDGIYEITPPDGFGIVDIYDAGHGRVFSENGKWFYELLDADAGQQDSFTVWFERLADYSDFEVRVNVLVESALASDLSVQESACHIFALYPDDDSLDSLLGSDGGKSRDSPFLPDTGSGLDAMLGQEMREVETAMHRIENFCN